MSVFLQRLGLLSGSVLPITDIIGGFSAYKNAASGSTFDDITDYDGVDHNNNNDFNLTTGTWTPSKGGLYWVGAMGFPEGGRSSSTEFSIKLKKDTIPIPTAHGRTYLSDNAHGSSCFIPSVHLIDVDADYNLEQRNDLSQRTFFSAAPFSSTSAFRAPKASSSGSVNAVITSYDTAEPNLGSDFNITTGVYTAPATDLYLITFHGFPTGATSAQHGPRLVVNGSDEGIQTYHDATGSAGRSNGFSVIKKLTVGDTVSIKQIGDVLETIAFSIIRVEEVSVSFSARKAASSGTMEANIEGWVEDWDDGSNFNPTTGVFTVPSSKRYLLMWYGHNDNWSSAESQIRLMLNDVEQVRSREYSSNSYKASHGGGVVLALTAGDELNLYQSNDLMEKVYFAVVEIID